MRVGEDAMQDARLKLIELGGRPAVRDPEAFVIAHARAAQYEAIRRDVKVEAAFCEAAGIFNSRAHSLLSEWRTENAEKCARYRKTPKGRVAARKNNAIYRERHGEAYRADQRARYRARKESPGWLEKVNAQRRAAYRLRAERQKVAA